MDKIQITVLCYTRWRWYICYSCARPCAAGDAKNAHLKVLEGADERLQLVKADLLDYDSVAAAIAGCEGVFHVACPVPSGRSTDPEVNSYEHSGLVEYAVCQQK